MRIMNKIKGVDILVIHQPPYIPELYPNMRGNEPAILMTQALEQIRPRLHFSGHMTGVATPITSSSGGSTYALTPPLAIDATP
jgi:predicted phosphohydrolase